MSKSKEIAERRIPLAQQLKQLVADTAKSEEGWTPELRAKFDQIESDLNELDRQAEDAKREERSTAYAEQVLDVQNEEQFRQRNSTREEITPEMRSNAIRAWTLAGSNPGLIEDRWVEDAKACGLDLQAKELNLRLMPRAPRNFEELREYTKEALTYRATTPQSLTAGAGGRTVANDNRLMASVERAMLAYGGQRNVSRILRTDSGNSLPIPLNDDTYTTAAILSENSTVTIASLAFGQVTLGAYKYASYVVSSFELLQDTAIDLPSFIGDALGTRIARGANGHWTTGEATSSQPHGAVSAASNGVTASGTTKIEYGRLVQLKHAVDPSYRTSPNFAFQMHDGILSSTRQLVDGNGNPMWQPSLIANEPDRLLGVPVNINQSMASSTTGSASKFMLCGDFSRHIIREVASLRLRRLDERLALADQVGWVAFYRTDSNVTVGSTVAAASQPIRSMVTT